jgi:hypothetical protein
MAKAKLSGYFQSIQGRIGDMIFTDTKVGTVMRADETPANPRTAGQNTYRAYFAKAAKGYPALTPSQADSWRVYAAGLRKVDADTKETYAPTGFNAFTSLAAKFYAANGNVGTPPTTPPATPFAGDSITLTAVATSGKVTFTASGANAANVTTELRLQPLKNANRKPSSHGYRIRAYNAFTAGVGGNVKDVTVPPGYYAAAYRFVNKLTGESTPLVYLSVSGIALGLEDGGSDEAPAASKRKAA